MLPFIQGGQSHVGGVESWGSLLMTGPPSGEVSKKDRNALAAIVQKYKDDYGKSDDDILYSMDDLPEGLFALIEKHVAAAK
jgi:hypothetical protein